MIKKFTSVFFIAIFNLITVRLSAQIEEDAVFAYEGFDYLNTAVIPMHDASTFVNIGTIKHYPYSNGWASDWQVGQLPATTNSAVPGYNINTGLSYQYIQNKDVINSGHSADGGVSPGVAAGRILQTSPAGPFSNNSLLTLDAGNKTYNGLITNPWPSTTGNKIGKDGYSLFISFLLQKKVNNVEPVYITLHSNSKPYDVDGIIGSKNIAIGYFGVSSETAGVKFWSVRINGVISQTSIPIDLTNPTYIVAGLSFNAGSGNALQLWINPLAIGVAGASIPIPDYSPPSFTGDNSFTTLGYYGGDSPSASLLDEIRFAGSYLSATQSSGDFSLVAGLCSGNVGDNAYAPGTFGIVGDGAVGDDEVANGTTCPGVTLSQWCNPNQVYFRKAIVPWSSFAPGLNYKDRAYLGGQQLNDGMYTIVTEVRGRGNPMTLDSPPTCGVPTGGNIPEWIAITPPSNRTDDYLMMLNCAWNPSIIYDQTVKNLCSFISYEFSVQMVNIIDPRRASFRNVNGCWRYGEPICDPTIEPGCQQFSSHQDFQNNGAVSGVGVTNAGCDGNPNCVRFTVSPDIEFLINGVVVYSLPAPIDNDQKWHKVGFTFVTKDLTSSIAGPGNLQLQIRNKAPGGNGNDLAIDNIQFLPCGPTITIDSANRSGCKIKLTASNTGIPLPNAFWQYVKDTINITKWSKVKNSDGLSVDFNITTNPADTGSAVGSYVLAGYYVRAVLGGASNDLTNAKCRINSNPLPLNCFIPLPVGLISFTANKVSDGVSLKWETSYEHNNVKFIVERAGEDQKFVDIGSVDGRGNSTNKNTYYFKDHSPLSGNNYYRLKQVDYDGKTEDSKIITINFSGLISVYPNPADKNLVIHFGDNSLSDSKVNIRFVNALGMVISEQNPTINKNENQIILENLPMSNGVYYLEILYQNSKTVKKIIISH